EGIARPQVLGGSRVPGVHVDEEARVRREERHLPLRVATIGAVRVRLHELADGEAFCGFLRRDTVVLAHGRSPHDSRMARGSTNAAIPYPPYSRPTPECLN